MDASFPTRCGLDHPRIAAHAAAAAPAWLWTLDGARVLWANAAGCAAFGVAALSALAARAFVPGDPIREEVAQLGATLVPDGAARLERLRGISGRTSSWRALTYSCAVIRLAPGDGGHGVLIVGADAAGRAARSVNAATDPGAPPAGDDAASAPPPAPGPGEPAHAPCSEAPEARAGGTAATDAGEAPEPPEPPSGTVVADDEPRPRPLPLRFTWQMDAAGRFTLGSDEFTEIIGTRIAIALGRPWQEINAELALDPENRFARAAATRETFSNIAVSWPVEGSRERLEVGLAGLPVFGRDRNFLGYRGFGVCRDADRIENLRAMRRHVLSPARAAMAGTSTPSAGPVGAAPAASPAGAPGQPPPDAAPHRPVPPAVTLPVQAHENVVRFPDVVTATGRQSGAPEIPALSADEHRAFDEIARHLAVRTQNTDAATAAKTLPAPPAMVTPAAAASGIGADRRSAAWLFEDAVPLEAEGHSLLNRLPSGILVYRFDELLFANRAFLALTGYPDLDSLAAAGGLDALFVECGIGAVADAGGGGKALMIATQLGSEVPVEGRLFTIAWNGEPACAVVLARIETDERLKAAETARRQAEAQLRELRLMIEATTDAFLVIDGAGHILSCDRGGEMVFGRRAGELIGSGFAALFAAQSRRDAAEGLAKARAGTGHVDLMMTAQNGDGREPPMSVTIKRIAADNGRFGVALREIAPAPAVPAAPAQESRAPGSETLRGSFATNLNEAITDTVARLQPDANAARIIIRMALSEAASPVTVEAGAVQRMVTILLRHAISTSPPGGQVILSTGVAAKNAYLRLRHSGAGDIPAPSPRPATVQPGAAPHADGEAGATGTPLASAGAAVLSLVKALAEANEAEFKVSGTAHEGSLYELSFPVPPAAAA